MPRPEDKPFAIPKLMVWEAWRQVKANKGAPGVDGQDLDAFESDLEGNLYKIWNRMSSGSYFPPPGSVHIPGEHHAIGCGVAKRAACLPLWRCSVLRWRELVVGAGMEEENLRLDTVGRIASGAGCPLAARGRTLGGRNRLGQSTARRRGGPARTSVEGPVMGLERRGRAGQLTRMPTRWSGRS